MPLIRRECSTESPNNSTTGLSRGHAPFLCDSDSLVECLRWGADEISEDGIGWKSCWLGNSSMLQKSNARNSRPVEPNPADDTIRVGQKVEAAAWLWCACGYARCPLFPPRADCHCAKVCTRINSRVSLRS
jgi:hypothetical protein